MKLQGERFDYVSVAEVILMLDFADAHRRLSDVRVPSAKTRKAMTELASGEGKKIKCVKALMRPQLVN